MSIDKRLITETFENKSLRLQTEEILWQKYSQNIKSLFSEPLRKSRFKMPEVEKEKTVTKKTKNLIEA